MSASYACSSVIGHVSAPTGNRPRDDSMVISDTSLLSESVDGMSGDRRCSNLTLQCV